MILQEKGHPFFTENKLFIVGGRVYANGNSEYEGLFGELTEIRTGKDAGAGGSLSLRCRFTWPDDPRLEQDIEHRASSQIGHPVRLADLHLDNVILSPGMLEPIPDHLPIEQGTLYALLVQVDQEDAVAATALAVSNDVGALIHVMWEDLASYEPEVVLCHTIHQDDSYLFSYEAKDICADELYLTYSIHKIPVLPRAALEEAPKAPNRGKADIASLLAQFQPGDAVRLTEGVLHPEFRGLCGRVVKTVKTRGLVKVACSDGTTYEASPDHVERLIAIRV